MSSDRLHSIRKRLGTATERDQISAEDIRFLLSLIRGLEVRNRKQEEQLRAATIRNTTAIN